MNIILSGACGRMGHEVARAAASQGIRILCGVDQKEEAYDSFPVFHDFSCVQPENGSVIIDFSLPSFLSEVLAFAKENHIPIVLATTGYTEEQIDCIRAASAEIPVFRSANMSLGVHVLKVLSRMAANLLPEFDIEIIEKHHNQKADAPSGTAIMLYDAVAGKDHFPVYDRHDQKQKRRKNEIGMLSVRGGTVSGEHEVGFYGNGESILIIHTAQNRSIFAEGALKAAAFLSGQTVCREYCMDDLFSI